MFDFNSLIGQIKLSPYGHPSPDKGMCAMEMVAWLEGLPHSDEPECTCPVIAAFVRRINDNMNQEGRDRLLAYLPRLVGTVSPEHEQERAEYLTWQAIRVFAPKALRAAGLETETEASQLERSSNFFEAERNATATTNTAYAAYAAAYAANTAANTADAAAYAAYADAAAYAADAAAYAANPTADYGDIFASLDGVLAIGRQSTGFSRPVEEPIAAAKELVGVS